MVGFDADCWPGGVVCDLFVVGTYGMDRRVYGFLCSNRSGTFDKYIYSDLCVGKEI